jgi:aryl-alcohol dehydrogenase-like predicted oxidoreductase
MDYVPFGETGLTASRLAFGTGTNGWGGRSEQSDLGVERLGDLLRLAHDLGVDFWDAADAYGSHPHIARALQTVARDEVVIATKTWSRGEEQVTRDIERFLMELRTGYLDVVLLHCMTGSDWPARHAGAVEALSRAKAEGKVRAVGASCHGVEALRAAAESGWVDVVLARINARGVRMGTPHAEIVQAIERLFRCGKAVYGMKVLGCGQLAHEARSAIRYVLSLGTVHALAVGTSSRRQLIENVRLVEELAPQYPLRTRGNAQRRALAQGRRAESIA